MWIAVGGAGFELPGVEPFVVKEAGGVVAFVEILEDGGKDFGGFFREKDAFGGCFDELGARNGGEKGGGGEDVFVGGEQAFGGADDKRNYWGGKVAG